MSNSPLFPQDLCDIYSPPAQLYVASNQWEQLLDRPKLAIVGSRRMSTYGKQVTCEFASRLAEQGIVIVSGLAYGVDAEAHRAALAVGGITIAVLPSPLDNIVPVAHRRLAEQIVEQGGALVTEYRPGLPPLKQNFILRNRLMTGLSAGVLVTEAGAKSGCQHTVGYASDQGKEIMVIPADITRPSAAGSNSFLNQDRAKAVTTFREVLEIMHMVAPTTPAVAVKGSNAWEQTVLDLMLNGIADGDTLLEKSNLSVSEFHQTLTMLEISSKIRPLGANRWALR